MVNKIKLFILFPLHSFLSSLLNTCFSFTQQSFVYVTCFLSCGRMEQAMWWVRGASDGVDADDNGGSARKWDTLILHIKTSLYKMLSELHKSRCNLQNHHHYTRLTKQCLDVLGGLQAYVTWQDLSPSDQLAVDGIYEYFKKQLDDGPP